jgi:hypothetical protein
MGPLDVDVRIKSGLGWTTINLTTAIRDALNAFAPSGFVFKCPDRMRVGSAQKVQLTIQQNLSDLVRQKLQEQGIPAEYLNGIMTLAVADLTSSDEGSFAIGPEVPSATGHSSDMWAWRVKALQQGCGERPLEQRRTSGGKGVNTAGWANFSARSLRRLSLFNNLRLESPNFTRRSGTTPWGGPSLLWG